MVVRYDQLMSSTSLGRRPGVGRRSQEEPRGAEAEGEGAHRGGGVMTGCWSQVYPDERGSDLERTVSAGDSGWYGWLMLVVRVKMNENDPLRCL